MPIEFSCESCQAELRVPDGTGGEACQCPSCDTIVTIPNEVAEAARSSPPERSTAPPPDELLAIPCPTCQQVLHCPTSLLGTKGHCPACKAIFTISPNPQAADQQQWIFHCPRCNQLFDGKPEMRGRRGKCHVCSEVFEIDLQPAPAASAPPPPQSGGLQIACGACEGVMEVPATAAGMTTECPFCKALLEIPA